MSSVQSVTHVLGLYRSRASSPGETPAGDDCQENLFSAFSLVLLVMDLFEYQGKQYFARYGIPVSAGGVADTVDQAVVQADKAGYPVVIKAQVQVGGRGKAGGIKLATNPEELRTHSGNILGMDIKGHVVRRLWIEHASDIAR